MTVDLSGNLPVKFSLCLGSSRPSHVGRVGSSHLLSEGQSGIHFPALLRGKNERHKVSQRETELRENILHLERARKRVYLFVGIWLCPVVSSGQSI